MNAKIAGYFLLTPDIKLPIVILEDKGFFLGNGLYAFITNKNSGIIKY